MAEENKKSATDAENKNNSTNNQAKDIKETAQVKDVKEIADDSPIRDIVKKHNLMLTLSVVLFICTFLPLAAAVFYVFWFDNPNILTAILIACSSIIFIVLSVLIRKQDLYYYKKKIVTAILEEKLKMRKYIFDNTKTISYLKDICNKSIHPNPPAIGVSDCFKANYRGVEFSFYDFYINTGEKIESLSWMGQLLVMTLNKPTDSLIMFNSKKEGVDFDSLFTLTTGTNPIADSDKVDVDNPYTATDLTDSDAVKSALVKLKFSAQSNVTIAFSYTRLYLFMENVFDPFEPNLSSRTIEDVTNSLRQEREILLSAIDPLIEADIVK